MNKKEEPESPVARSIRAKNRLVEHRMSSGFSAFSLRSVEGISLDPFLNVDEFRMREPTFPPHPHAGFSAVTYMFEDSPGSFTNRDSLGDASIIGPGALHWTQAAHGMVHEEIPAAKGVECHGLQIFVNLRAEHKSFAPRAFHVDGAAVPEWNSADVRVRVLAGDFGGVPSPLTQLLTPVLLLDIQLAPNAEVHVPVPADWNAFALVVRGNGTSAEGARFEAHDALSFARDGEAVLFKAHVSGAQIVVCAGAPIGEPVVFGGPFAMTNRADIEEAFARFRRGEMGHLAPSF